MTNDALKATFGFPYRSDTAASDYTILDVFLFPDVSLHLVRSGIGFTSIAVLAVALVGEPS